MVGQAEADSNGSPDSINCRSAAEAAFLEHFRLEEVSRIVQKQVMNQQMSHSERMPTWGPFIQFPTPCI